MTDKREVTITVREYGFSENAVGLPPHNLVEAIQAFQETLLEIPPEYRESAEISFEPEWHCGEYYRQVRITYERPETPEEEASRKEEERAAVARWIDEQEALIRRRKAEFGI